MAGVRSERELGALYRQGHHAWPDPEPEIHRAVGHVRSQMEGAGVTRGRDQANSPGLEPEQNQVRLDETLTLGPKTKASALPYISVTIPAHTALGQTVDTTIGNRPARVTVIAEGILRIEP